MPRALWNALEGDFTRIRAPGRGSGMVDVFSMGSVIVIAVDRFPFRGDADGLRRVGHVDVSSFKE